MRFGFCVALALSVAGVSIRANADEPTPEERALYKEGLALVEQAKDDRDPAKYEAARQKFLQVYAMVHHRPNALLSVALAERDLHRAPEAARHLRQFLRLPDTEPDKVRKAREELAKLQPWVATLTISAPAGAAIRVDGLAEERAAPLPDPLDLSPGHHTIEARMNGARAEKEIDLAAGSVQSLDLQPAPPPEPEPGPAAVAPVAPVPRDPSPSQEPNDNAAHGSAVRTVVLVATGGATVLAAGLAVGFRVGASSARSREDMYRSANGVSACAGQSSSGCTDWNDAARTRAHDNNLTAGFGVTAGLFAAGFFGTLLLWPRATSTTIGTGIVRVAPACGTTGCGGSIWGQF